ncbi:unnamed protein product, partial [Mesorhabditis spiculigera]
MLVLVTGAAGFIGSHTVLELIEAGYEVYCIDNFSNSISDESGNALSLKRVEELTGKKIAFEKADDWNIVILRYFNPVGAHPSGKIGEDPQGIPNNLMPFVSQVAIGRLPAVSIFGTKWATPDGTGVRDYIHIVDLAKGHVKALDRIKKEGHVGTEIFNLGTGRGYSVLEMVAALEKASGLLRPGARRAKAGLEGAKLGRHNTIDLGFSSIAIDDKRLALIDCPGHSSLIRSVLAASTVFDMAIVVVDASHGIEQQTAEHLLLASLNSEIEIPMLREKCKVKGIQSWKEDVEKVNVEPS